MNDIINTIKQMDDEQLDMVLHASGLNRTRIVHRRSYNTYEWSEPMQKMVKLHVFSAPRDVGAGESKTFFLTKLGEKIAHVLKKSVTIEKSNVIGLGVNR
jgi:hypothetical protein